MSDTTDSIRRANNTIRRVMADSMYDMLVGLDTKEEQQRIVDVLDTIIHVGNAMFRNVDGFITMEVPDA